jgi:hypothetical protein
MKEENAVHPIAEDAAGGFSKDFKLILDSLSDLEKHFIACSVAVLQDATGISYDDDEARRFHYLLVLYGWWIGRENKDGNVKAVLERAYARDNRDIDSV